jgi:hypothetical protein
MIVTVSVVVVGIAVHHQADMFEERLERFIFLHRADSSDRFSSRPAASTLRSACSIAV